MTLQKIVPVLLLLSTIAVAAEPQWSETKITALSSAAVEIDYELLSGRERVLGRLRGLLVSKEGLVLTSGSIRATGARVQNIRVRFLVDRSVQDAVYLGKDEELDLAFLRVPAKDIPKTAEPVAFAENTTAPALTERVAIAGRLSKAFGHEVYCLTGRIVARFKNPVPLWVSDIRTLADTTPAAVLNQKGEVIGLAVRTTDNRQTVQAQIFSGCPVLPAAQIRPLIETPPIEAVEKERQHGWLGILMAPLTPELARHWKLAASGGIIISQVFDGSPAVAAGLQQGDILTSFNGREIRATRQEDLQTFVRLVKNTPIGKAVAVEYIRDSTLGKDLPLVGNRRFVPGKASITLGVRPRSALYERYFEDAATGLTLKDISMEDRVAYHFDASLKGVMVLHVEEGSWAHLARLQPGDIIARIDNHKVESLTRYQKVIQDVLKGSPKAILFFVHRQGGTVFLVMKPRQL